MAIGLRNFPNIIPADSDYLSGRIKDNPGDGSGTPVNQLTNGDIQEFFAKLMNLASITPNGIPDNEYSGHQYIDALKGVIQQVIDIINPNGLITKVIDIGDWNMPSVAQLNVAHGLSDWTKIRSINVIIRNDSIGSYFNLLVTEGSSSNIVRANSTNIVLNRIAGGVFDNTQFDSTSFNRGWITIQYLP